MVDRLWRWFIKPSDQLTEPDQLRQAALLSGFLLGLIVLAVVVEAGTVAFIDWATYTGYRQTIVAVVVMVGVYALSRTRHTQWAAILAVIVISAATFVSGWAEPEGVLGGFFDYLILPLWVGSLFIPLRRLPWLIGTIMVGLLLFPLTTSKVTLDDILVGPFSFLMVTSIILIIITYYRNRLEQDRQTELLAKELRSRHEAARADALLRVADRLNGQLDLEAVLSAIGEEVSQALETAVAVVTLYDEEQAHFYAVAGVGVTPDFIKNLPPFPLAFYKVLLRGDETAFAWADLQSGTSLEYLTPFKERNLRSIAFTTMEYEHELIGGLSALTVGDPREFSKDELLLLKGLADQAAVAVVNTRLYKDARRRLENLQALRTIDIAITTNHNIRDNLDVLLHTITEQLKVDAAVFLLLDAERQQLEFALSLGFHTTTLRFTRLRPGEGVAGQAARQRKIIRIEDLRTDPQTLAYAPTLAQEGFVSYYAAPLIAQDQIKGVLEIFHRSALNPDAEWLSFLEALAGQAAIAIESTSLFENLRSANLELSRAYDSTIEGWSHALDLRDKETEGHTQRVTQLTLKLAEAVGLRGDELVRIHRGALLHDIGKMGVPDHILLKPGKLTDEEWVVMRKHPTYAYELLSPIAYLRPALDIPYCHHEWWDGSGYPRGLKGEAIPFAARLFAVVDVWDALCSDRPYRSGWPPEKVMAHIQAEAGTHFDPQVVEAFLKLLKAQ